MEELLTLPGVGRKTANLVLILSFRSLKNICVDTHVHRISNRLGWVQTRTPDETEQSLYKATAERWWPYINLYLVTWGQNVCRPLYPRCGECVIRPHCAQVGARSVEAMIAERASELGLRNVRLLLCVLCGVQRVAQPASPGLAYDHRGREGEGGVEIETFPTRRPKRSLTSWRS